MGRRLFIGNLSHDTTEVALQAVFRHAGTVSEAQVVVDRFTGRSRGFGFVEMGSDGEAQKAIEQLQGCDVDGRAITVNAAQERAGGPRAKLNAYALEAAPARSGPRSRRDA